ncbi:acyltransferase [Pedobacter ginsengisoli]|uniref:Acyltransferase n=1 Tax=Pedobacter ginsengisoli TaxID=363852 RepID=A0A2D1U692_9SPHI|nr:acyltransferase [Pedobacter ginsengisoli]ATP57129.1 acyltransferase [Pedobacter ginsengisoli]
MSTTQLSSDTLKTKQHFDILDGLRGIAAISVVIFHFMEMAITDYSKNFIAHGFLAVDFFFCLSGFVIGYAYDDRIGKMGVKEFFKSRLIRLHPLVILGSILGLLTFLFAPYGGNPEAYSAGKIILIFLSSILLIPFPSMTERSFNLFSFNAPAWSLFWEYIANIVYAFILCRLSRRVLLVLTAISAVALCFVSYRSGNLMGGWGQSTFWDGSIRILYSFLAGLVIYRSNWIIKNKLGFISLSILLFLAFIMPFNELTWLTEPLVVLFYFPLIIALGAGAELTDRLRKLCVFSGKISYPLYMTHYAVIWMFLNYYTANKPDTTQLSFIVVIGTMLLLAVAYLFMVLYDIPVRKYLTAKRKQV